MPTPLPGPIPASIDSVEKLFIYSAQLYRLVAAGRRYSERSDADLRPFLQHSIDDVFGQENNSQTFMIIRGAVPLKPTFDALGEKIWANAPGLNGSVTIPPGYTN